MDIETLAMALALSKSKGNSSGGTDENLQNAVQALSNDICPNRYTSGSNPEIQSGSFFYIDDDMHLRISNDLIPANSSREDIDNSSRLVTSNGGLSDAINFLLHNSEHNNDALWDLFDDICPNRYMSGSNPEIEPNQFFYLDENMHLRRSSDLIPANSSEEDIKNLSIVITNQGGLSDVISFLLANANNNDNPNDLQNTIDTLKKNLSSVSINVVDGQSQEEIPRGCYFYWGDVLYQADSNIPRNSSPTAITYSCTPVYAISNNSGIANILRSRINGIDEGLSSLKNNVSSLKYTSGNNPEIEPNRFFYIDSDTNLRCSNDLIPANSSRQDIDNLSSPVTSQGGVSNTISSLLKNEQSAIQALSKSICPDRYTSGSNPEIEQGDFFYIDDDQYLRYAFNSVPANSSREDIDHLSITADNGVGLTNALKMALENNDEISDLYNQFIEFKSSLSSSIFYGSTSQTMGTIEPGYYFYLENELRQASETIPQGANSSDLRQKSNPVAHGIANKLQNNINSVEEGLSSLKNDLSSLKYTSGSNPEIQPGRLFYLDDYPNLRYSQDLIPANSSREDIDRLSISIVSQGGLSGVINLLSEYVENDDNAIQALFNDMCSNRYTSGSNPDIQPNRFFYIDDDLNLRFSANLIPANSSRNDIDSSSISIASVGGLSSAISSLLVNAQSGSGDEKKSSITLYKSDNDAITSVISIGTQSGSLQTGDSTNATGAFSHAEGSGTTASGNQSHAEGNGTKASKAQSHAEGMNTTASGASSHAEGNGTTANGDRSHAEGNSTKAIGLSSHAEGNGTTANGSSSHAEGVSTTASGDQSHAEGGSTTASGASSHAEGGSTTASGAQSHAEGYGGTYDLKQGTTTKTITSGAFYTADHSEGYQTVAGRPLESGEARSIFGAHAEGYHTQATGDASHAEGAVTVASGDQSHAEGNGTTASGMQSHAEGKGTTASSASSHAEGGGTTASGLLSHAEGSSTTASGAGSHAEGNSTTASGMYSHAEGKGTSANHASQHVFGQYNIEDPSTASVNNRGTYVEIVGNGTKSSARSNARTLDWSGNETLTGNISAEGGSLTLGSGANAVTITAAQLQQLLDMLQS